jgi:hypothetical protein
MSILDGRGEFFRYRAYGLTLQANRPLPGLMAASANAPVDVWVDLMGDLGSKPSAPQATPNFTLYQNQEDEFGMRVWTEQTGDGHYTRLWFRGYVKSPGKVDFRIDEDGKRVWCTWTYTLVEDVIALLLGSVLGYVLRLRGTACLHACTVAVGERAIAIFGEKGAGKSTTAAALSQRQMSILSDDIAVLNDSGKNFSVQPGYPHLRLWPEAIHALYGPEVALPRVLTGLEKRYVNLIDDGGSSAWRFQSDPLPLAAIYVLGERVPSLAAPAIEPIPPATAVMALMAHRSASFLTLDREKQAREFAFLSRVAVTVPVRKVSRPDSLDALPQLCDAILEDLAGIPTPEKCTL